MIQFVGKFLNSFLFILFLYALIAFNRVFRFSGIFSNSALSLRIGARGKKYLSDVVLDYTRILLFFIVLSDCYTK